MVVVRVWGGGRGGTWLGYFFVKILCDNLTEWISRKILLLPSTKTSRSRPAVIDRLETPLHSLETGLTRGARLSVILIFSNTTYETP